MSLELTVRIISTYLILKGVWSFFDYNIKQKGYTENKEQNESQIDFYLRWYNNIHYKIVKRLKLGWVYTRRWYKLYRYFIGIIKIILGISFLILLRWLKTTPYEELVTYKF